MHTPTDSSKAVGEPSPLSTGGTANEHGGVGHFEVGSGLRSKVSGVRFWTLIHGQSP